MEVRALAGQENGAGKTGVGDWRDKDTRGSGWAPEPDEWDWMGLGRAVTRVGAPRYRHKAGRKWGRWLGTPVVWGTLT